MFDSPNSTPNLNPSFHPLSNLPLPSSLPLFINTHQDLLLDHHFPVPGVHETLIVSEMSAPGFCTPHSSSKLQATAAKKGRHSKIHTSQGLRDRRVRLSIGISRQFFDLQDMLGFDKPSKTLDWLLSKSKNAIRELARSSKHDSIGSNQNGDEHVNNPHNLQTVSKKKKTTRSARKKICCGNNPTAMNQSDLTRSSASDQVNHNQSCGPFQKDKNHDNDYYFPNLALDWDSGFNPASSFVVPNVNLSETGLFNISLTTSIVFGFLCSSFIYCRLPLRRTWCSKRTRHVLNGVVDRGRTLISV